MRYEYPSNFPVKKYCSVLQVLASPRFALSVEEETSALEALQCIEYTNPETFKLALKTVLCRSRKEIRDFDDLFIDYWKELEKAIDSKKKPKQNRS